MFTGLIEEVGHVENLSADSGTKRLTVAASHLPREMKQGDSIAVSGVCLTAVDIHPGHLGFDLAEETLARTSLSRLQRGALVNLELPMKADGRMGGHIVQGHVDGVAKFVALERIEGKEDYWLKLEIPADLARYVVFKGSIAVEGISLTVARIEANEVTIAIIPHTYEMTNLKQFRPGDPMNIEVDIIAKYAEKMILGQAAPGNVTLERLMAEGF
ncbi:MAG: riboflavin synthase [Acidobacteria bacterium]|nr:riboflavin synthase [Acidobacteriaceae bacterium]MBV9608945.1 riboflavin synthase [Acidobacteriota bacterium]